MSAEDDASAPRSPEAPIGLPALLNWRPAPLNTCEEGSEGLLVFWGERLIAVLGRFELEHRAGSHLWHLEIGFGDCAAPPSGMVFDELAQALRWLAERSEPDAS